MTDHLSQEKFKKRINIIKGQLNGLLKMIAKDEYCIDLLNQSLAIQNSLKSLDALILERHLRIHVADQFKTKKETAVNELIKVFKRSNLKT
jgi:CsoR family transcriptional regulator, copper-sensing transcriptional repressor